MATLEHLTEEQIEKRKKWAARWDKVTTAILIILMASPVAILAYIFIWFMTK